MNIQSKGLRLRPIECFRLLLYWPW